MTDKTPHKIYAEAMEELNEDEKVLLKSAESIKRDIIKQRQKLFPELFWNIA